MTAQTTSRAVLRHGRTATSLLFLLFGAVLGAWTSRIPSVKTRRGLSDGLLSLALLAFAVGAIAGTTVLGRLADRFGGTRLMVPMGILEGLLLIPPAHMPGLVTLPLALFLVQTGVFQAGPVPSVSGLLCRDMAMS
jgi:predicted MFS family arabinose efflux permease